jgi:hypothetical protein
MALFLEAVMSKHGSSEESIPVVILVSGQANKPNRPAPKRKSTSSANQLPWFWIAVGGGVAWLALVLVIAIASFTREPEQPTPPNLMALAKLGAVEPAFRPPVAEKVEVDPVIEAIDDAAEVNVAKALPAFQDPVFANCEQIGTKVLFVRNPPEAFKRAKAEKKMVFVVHLSGNLEDKEFT